MTNILLADDHQIVLDGLKLSLGKHERLNGVGEVSDGQQVLDFLDQTKNVDLVILDINMPILEGLQVAKRIKAEYSSVKILVLTMYKTASYITNLIKIGAEGYVLKNSSAEEFVTAIDTVISGRTCYDEALMNIFKENISGKPKVLQDVKLTRREKDVINCLANELTSNEIAEKLSLSPYTVETHRKNIILKLHVKGTVGVIKYAIAQGIVNPIS